MRRLVLPLAAAQEPAVVECSPQLETTPDRAQDPDGLVEGQSGVIPRVLRSEDLSLDAAAYSFHRTRTSVLCEEHGFAGCAEGVLELAYTQGGLGSMSDRAKSNHTIVAAGEQGADLLKE